MSLDELFQFTLNIEEAAINPAKYSEGNACSSKDTKTETAISWKQWGGKGKQQKRSGSKSSILKGQDRPSCDFCGRQGHTDTSYHIKEKATASAKKETKYRSAQWKKGKAEKAQSFAAEYSASASTKQEESSDEDEDDKYEKAFMNSFMASWKTSKNNKKSQKNKHKRSDNDTSNSEQNYSKYFKLVAFNPKRARIGIPTT
jgi:hypothetical protein